MAFTKLINLDTLKTAVDKLKTLIAGKVSKTGDTMTGKLTAPKIETGTDEANYFQSKKFRGEGNAGSYYHAIDFGYAQHNKVDFHEYGAEWNFYKNTGGTQGNGQLVAQIKEDGVHAPLKGNADTATKATQDAKGNVIDATYIKTADGLKKWYGTKAEYDALTSYDDDTIYITTDENADTYVDSASFQAHLNNKNNPHEVTAAQLGVYTKSEVDTAINNHNVTTDSELSETSENPIQNKVVTSALESKADKSTLGEYTHVYHGTTLPSDSAGADGDVFLLYKESSGAVILNSIVIYLKLASKWNRMNKIDVNGLALTVTDTTLSSGHKTFTVALPSDFTGTTQWEWRNSSSVWANCGETGNNSNSLQGVTASASASVWYRLKLIGTGDYVGTTYVYRAPK